VVTLTGLAGQTAERKDAVRPAVYNQDAEEQAGTEVSLPKQQPCQGWPKPAVALIVTGRQSGYIEPCGCTGLDNAKGGLSRRHTLIQQLAQKGWPLVMLDVGNQVRRFGKQAEIKFQTTIAALRAMGYDAIGVGPDDLRLSIGELAVAVMGDDDGKGPFVSANVNILEWNLAYRVIERGGLRIGVTAVLGREEQAKVNSQELTLVDPVAGLQKVMPSLLAKKCHLYVLLAHASLDESRSLARQFPEFGVIVTAGGAGEPTLEPEPIPGTRAHMIQVGTKGMYVGVVGLYPGSEPPLRYERVALDSRFPDSPTMLDGFALYQKQLESLGLQGLEVKPVKFPSRSGKFVGHEVCGECHTTAYEIFENSPHFHATDSISHPTERSSSPRHHDPECLRFHVTGWDPQGYDPYESGYLDLEESIALHTNGCENCHGPGSEHVAAENGDVEVSDEELARLRQQMRLTLADAKKDNCYRCHDLDNSPDFDFDTYWEEVKHYGKD
jgi:hypothetical protein